ncbi:MAG: MarR family transcriptional regulator [Beijerinckiaceae bacterium]
MQMQNDLFNPRTLARRHDPETSKEAAKTVREFAGGHHAQILDALAKHPDGLTAHEIAAFCQIDAHQVGKRINELEKAGRIENIIIADGDSPDGYTVLTRATPGGRQARVWRLA